MTLRRNPGAFRSKIFLTQKLPDRSSCQCTPPRFPTLETPLCESGAVVVSDCEGGGTEDEVGTEDPRRKVLRSAAADEKVPAGCRRTGASGSVRGRKKVNELVPTPVKGVIDGASLGP